MGPGSHPAPQPATGLAGLLPLAPLPQGCLPNAPAGTWQSCSLQGKQSRAATAACERQQAPTEALTKCRAQEICSALMLARRTGEPEGMQVQKPRRLYQGMLGRAADMPAAFTDPADGKLPKLFQAPRMLVRCEHETRSTQSLVRQGTSELGILGSEGPPNEGCTPGREQQDSSLHPFPRSAAGLWPNGPHSDCMSTTQLLLQATSVWPTDGQRLERGLSADNEHGQQRWRALRMGASLPWP